MRASLAVLSFALVALVACAPPGPAIQEVHPAKGEPGVAADAPVRIVFSRDMDRVSVESRLSLQPAIAGCDLSACPVSWSGRTMILAHLNHQFAADTAYRVRLRSGYRDSAGTAAAQDHFWDFRTEAAPTITAVLPADGATAVPIDADLSVQLSRDLRPPQPGDILLTAEGELAALPARVTVSPDDPRRLLVAPLSLLHPRSTYTLHVAPGLSDKHHNPLAAAHDYHFSTGRLDLSRSLAFLIRDAAGQATRIGLLRPPAGVNAPAPTIRVVYGSSAPLLAFGWSADSSSFYALEAGGRVMVAAVDGSPAVDSGRVADALAPSPARPEVALVRGGALAIWRPGAATGDVPIPQAGRLLNTVPAWSGDGRRLALAVDDGHGGAALRILDRDTLSVSDVPEGTLVSGGGSFSWSADGAALAFIRPGSEVWSYRPLAAAGPGLSRIGSLDASGLAWSSDTATLFASGGPVGRLGAPRLERAPGQPLEGQAVGFTPLPGSGGGDTEPTTPSFDRRVAFLRPAAGARQLYMMNNDGTGVTQLTFASYYPSERLTTDGVDQPRWSPGNAP
ncbi:MAG: Ig-like domain-containing protein [Candidatus Dormibacteria bacterium]